jgi:hypothetical protein
MKYTNTLTREKYKLVAGMSAKIALRRRFDGKSYRFHQWYSPPKEYVVQMATQLRKNGWNVRIVKQGLMYIIYRRKK